MVRLLLGLLIISIGSLCGCVDGGVEKTAYEQAVALFYSGSEKEFFEDLALETIGQGCAYNAAVEKGYAGTRSQWLTPLVAKTVSEPAPQATAYELAVESGYTGSGEQWLNSISKSSDNLVIRIKETRASFAWIDDDGKSYVYSTLYPWAVENQVPFTTAMITGKTTNYLTCEQILEMYESGLVEVASHTQNHKRLPTLSDDQLSAEIVGSKQIIESWGVPCEVLVYPFGEIDQRGVELAREHYRYGLVAGGPENSAGVHIDNRVNYPPISTYGIERIAIAGEMGEEELRGIEAQIDEACANNGLIVFMSHVSSNGAQDLAVYTRIVNYIRSKGQDIEPVTQVLDRFSNPVEIGGWTDKNPEGYLVIGADGAVRLDNLNGQVVLPDNSYTNASTPNSYPQNQITTCYITGGSVGAGLPGGSRGILTAYLVGKTGYRMFIPAASADQYIQLRSSTADKWNAWIKVNENVTAMLSNNKIDHTTRPDALPSGVSMCIVTKDASLNALPGDGGMGYFTNYKISTNAANVRQEWRPFDSVTTYIRLADSYNKWGPWYKLEPVPVE
jgi:peptidoglycan/xylan/chitin deacetylase (PgdA/CDA1 family)